MTTITDEQLDLYAARVNGKVVVITGAASGIGKETATRFAKYGAKIVIGDLDIQGATKVLDGIVKAGGQGAVLSCDVSSWEDQVALFELAEKRFGSVDVVIANAGIAELGDFTNPDIKDGKPVKPNWKTMDVNLTGSLYTAYVGLHYLRKGKKEGDLKSVVLIGSMASWQAPTNMPMYAASKHGVLGFMRAVYPSCRREGIRISIIHPWFADTKIISDGLKAGLVGLPMVPLHRVAGAILYSATDPDLGTSGCPWLLPDGGPVFRLEKDQLKEGVYRLIDKRIKL
ncbi:NAD(P)-binding protein [Athelia psychrophila]|uniref:NAD(P)-binding protein n=1 Tax=Athelia psychrophila TaxID=1759441 RepID=A0A166X4N6_9AGAM|nr:NAD(P)-binding protein [Fibularhizoctonia sp. CBS 109695]